MTKKLWTVTVSTEFEMAVLAETQEEALRHAKKNSSDELTYCELDYHVSTQAPPADLDDTFPYGECSTDRTVGDWKRELGVSHPMDQRLARLREVAEAEGASK
jgi:hypothetical protein